MPVSGLLLQEKAKLLFKQLYPDSPKLFCASRGFQWRFGKRHGIKNISIQGEKELADMISACDIQFNFNLVIGDYTHEQVFEQVFNCDEIGLQFHLLPQKILAVFLKGMQKEGKRIKIA